MSKGGDGRFALVATVVYAVLVGIGIWHHEMYRDEWQTWLLARDSAGIAELLFNMRYEGHPAGWHLLLFGLSRITRSAVAMQITHGLIATTAMWIFFRYAPFDRSLRLLAGFGYFPLYEYAIVTRSYALGMLLLFVACTTWRLRHRTPWPFVLTLALLVHTSAYGTLLAFALSVAFAVEWIIDREFRSAVRPARTVLAAVVLAGSTAVAVATMRPPVDARFTGRSLTSRSEVQQTGEVRNVALVPARVVLPIPDFKDGVPVWGVTAAVEGGMVPNAALVAGLVGLIIIALIAWQPAALAAFLSGGLAVLAFNAFVHTGKFRHHGQLLLLLLASLWLAHEAGVGWKRDGIKRFLTRVRPVARITLMAALTLHVLTAGIMYVADIRLPFSPSRAVTKAIAEHGGDRLPLAGSRAAYAISVAGAFDKPLYFVESDMWGTFAVWNAIPSRVDSTTTLAGLASVWATGADEVLLVTTFQLPSLTSGGTTALPIPLPDAPVIGDERLWAYRVLRTARRP